MTSVIHNVSPVTGDDAYLFSRGAHYRLYEKLGAHPASIDGADGTHFALWAPNAEEVSVIGDFNGWDPDSHALAVRWDSSGIWEGFIPGVGPGEPYKFHIVSKFKGYTVDKADPMAFFSEVPPRTSSVVCDPGYEWGDNEWMASRAERNSPASPISIYEVHLGSWKRAAEEHGRFLSYREIAPLLAEYVLETGFTHVELLPVMEHPFYGSWGYQMTGFFAPTARYGAPEDLMYLIDHLHQRGIGVILDWVPSHFPCDEHGLGVFDGTCLYEHDDPRKGFHPDWKSCIFNYGRNEVRSFLISSAILWLDRYHIDGLRVDAVASMLYLDYSRKKGEWEPNKYGGRENLEAISFLKQLNETVYREYPDTFTAAEESTAWPMVTRPTYLGGLGFGMKWNMGWMNDTLRYFSTDPVNRKHHHDELTFSIWYAFSENFILPLSHDEVVHCKGSLLGKMPGKGPERFANLRLLLGYMYAHPGKKLLFMGSEFAQSSEWSHDSPLDWGLLEESAHSGIRRWVRDLNALYANEDALHSLDFDEAGFEWVDCRNSAESVIGFIRRGSRQDAAPLIFVCNMTPVERPGYRTGVPSPGIWRKILNSDREEYGGSAKAGAVEYAAVSKPAHDRPWSITITLPPLSMLVFKAPAA